MHFLDLSKPYVYKATNPSNGEFYIGYRSHNVKLGKSINEDLGVNYFSSSKHVTKEFKFEVLVVCENKDIAYFYEQRLIKSFWGNPLLINKHFVDVENKKRYFKCDSHSEETRLKMSKSRIGKTWKMSDAAKQNLLKVRKSDHYRNCGKNTKRTFSEEEKVNVSRIAKEKNYGNWMNGRFWFTDGISSIQCNPEDAPTGWKRGRTCKQNKKLFVVYPGGNKVETNNLEMFCRENESFKLDAATLRITNENSKHKNFYVIKGK